MDTYSLTQGQDTALPRNISNSEVMAWLTCQRKYYYAFDLDLEPKGSDTGLMYGTALNRGTIVHEALANYYSVLADTQPNKNYLLAEGAAMSYLTSMMDKVYDETFIMEIMQLVRRYFEYAKRIQDNWKILAVEEKYEIPVNVDYTFTMRLDLLVNINGEIVIVDHKTVYDFWHDDDLKMNPQMPKYIGALRFNGMLVQRAIVNQIRTRTKKSPMTDDELFRECSITPSNTKIRNILTEQFTASDEILKHRALSLEDRSKHVKRTMGKMTCGHCSMLSLCHSELEGQSIEHDIAMNFKQNTYSAANQLDEIL